MQTDDFSSVEVDPGAALAPALTILYHPDLRRIGDRAVLTSAIPGATVALSRDTLDFGAALGTGPRALEHACVSRTPVLLTRTPDGGVRVSRGDSRTKLAHR